MSRSTSEYGAYGHTNSFDVANEHRRDVMLWKAEIDTLKEDLKAKEKIEARVYELYRNNPFFRGLVETQVDTLVGSKVILQANPDWETLGVSQQEARAWSKIVEREFHRYVNSDENWVSADRTMDFTQLMRSACRQEIFTGEIIASREWRRSPLGLSTCVQLVSSNRLKQPSNSKQAAKAFYGIEMDRYGAPIAYHIESHDPIKEKVTKKGGKKTRGGSIDQKSFKISDGKGRKTKRYTRYNSFGWLQIWHVFDKIKPEYPRGISRLASTLIPTKQLERFDQADLDKAIISTSYVYAITSDEDPETVADMLSGVEQTNMGSEFKVGDNIDLPAEVVEKRKEIMSDITDRFIKLSGGQMLHLFKGEDIKIMASPNTIQTSADFRKSHQKGIAKGAGVSFELASGDLEGVNFSGGQMSLGIYEHAANIRRETGIYKFARLVYRSILDEMIDKGIVPLLGGVEYFANRESYSRGGFSGAKRIHLDPVKKENSNTKGLSNLTKSRTQIINEEGGDFDKLTQDRSDEAQSVVENVRGLASRLGFDVDDKTLMKIAIDIIAGNGIEPPTETVEVVAVEQ